MKFLFSLLLSSLLLSPLLAFAGKGVGKALPKPTETLRSQRAIEAKQVSEEQRLKPQLNSSAASLEGLLVANELFTAETIDFLNQISADNGAGKLLIERAEKIHKNLSISGLSPEGNFKALAFALRLTEQWAKNYDSPLQTETMIYLSDRWFLPERLQSSLENHIRHLSQGIGKITAERQAEIVTMYWNIKKIEEHL